MDANPDGQPQAADPATEWRNRATACMADIEAACARHRCAVTAYVTQEPVGGSPSTPPARMLVTASWVVMPLA